MTFEQVEDIIKKRNTTATAFQIRFKARNSMKGIFIKSADYNELSRKNLWRVVSESRMESYMKSHDENLSRIFNGTEFTKLQLIP